MTEKKYEQLRILPPSLALFAFHIKKRKSFRSRPVILGSPSARPLGDELYKTEVGYTLL